MKGIHLLQRDLAGVRFAVNVFIGSAILWYLLRHVADTNPIWAIASMIAASEPVVKEAARMFRQACDGGDVNACIQLASQLAAGQGVAKNAVAAAGLYRKACDVGNMNGCLGLGWTYQSGQGVAKDASQAASIYRKVCDAGSAFGCTNLAMMISIGEVC